MIGSGHSMIFSVGDREANFKTRLSSIVGRATKFFQSFSILSSNYLVVIMAIDRCLAIVTPLRAGKIRVS